MGKPSLRGTATARVLVVASQCSTMPYLERLDETATGLHDAMRDPDLGACEPGLPDGRSLLLATSGALLGEREITDRIRDAYRYAGETQATLILALLGHGFSPPGGGGLYFMADNSELDDRDSAVDVTALLVNAADRQGVDGVLALLDMCSAGAASPNTSVLTGGFRQGSTRLAVLMATAAGQDAYDMAFSATLTGLLLRGVPNAGEYLTPDTLTAPLANALRDRQEVQRFEWDGNAWTGRDVGMWLTRNRAVTDAWGETLDAEWARQLTATYHDTPTRRRLLSVLSDHRMVALVAPSGQGKSVLIAGLTQSHIAGADTAHAVVFADRRYTLADIAHIVSDQLAVRLSGHFARTFVSARKIARSANSDGVSPMAESDWAASFGDGIDVTADAWEVELARPLAKLATSATVTICVDGTDQLHPAILRQLVERLRALLAGTGPGIRVVLAGQPEKGLTVVEHAAALGAELVTTTDLDIATITAWLDDRGTPAEVGGAVLARYAGSWLLAGLLLSLAADGVPADQLPGDLNAAYELIHHRTGTNVSEECWITLGLVLAANGPNPLPLEVVHAALAAAGQALDMPTLRDVLTRLRPVLIRLRPGTPHEILRPLHATYSDYLSHGLSEQSLRAAHGWLLDACDNLMMETSSGDRVSGGTTSDPVAAYIFTTRPEHLFGTGQMEALADAIGTMQDHRRLHAADRRDDWSHWLDRVMAETSGQEAVILDLRQHRAYWTGQSGGAVAARDQYRALIQDQLRILSADRPEILAQRSRLAYWTGQAGDPAAARDYYRLLLADQQRVLGADHPDTLATRCSLARWTGEVGSIADRRLALKQLAAVLEDQVRILGQNHPDTFTSRRSLAYWIAETGDRARARKQLSALVDDQIRVLGPDHPDTFAARGDLAHWTAQIGDRASARDLVVNLLADQLRVLGPDHPATFATRANLARWTGEAGDYAAAQDQMGALLEHQRQVLGPDHPATFATRARLVSWTGRAGDLVTARDQGHALLKDMRRVLGPEDMRTSRMSRKIASWTAASGPRQLAALLQDQQRVLGPDHPDTLDTRTRLANHTGQASNPAAARDQYAALLHDQQRVLGPHHPNTLSSRDNLAYWTGMAGDPAVARDQYANLLEDVWRIFKSDEPGLAITRPTSGGDAARNARQGERGAFLAFTTRNRLAHWTGEAGDPAAARDQYTALLKDQLSKLGPDHPDTFATRASVVRWTGRAGDASAARTLGHSLLEDMRRVFGPEDPRTARTEERLARWAANRDASTGHLVTLLEDQQRVPSPDHPTSLATRANLADLTGRAGNPAAARDQYRALLRDQQRVLGPEHSQTFATRARLAHWTGRAGNSAAARSQGRALLDDMRRVYGSEDIRIARTKRALARWTADSAPLPEELRTLVEEQKRLLGLEHPDTLATRGRLADRTGEVGEPEAARDQLTVLLEDQLRVLGADHPATLATRASLAHWTGKAGASESAREQFAALVEDQRRVLGIDHTDTFTVRHRLAYWSGTVGDADAARDQYRLLVSDQQRALGPDHPDTFTNRANLARWTWAAGDAASAQVQCAMLLEDMARVFGPGDSRTTRMKRRLARWTAEPADTEA